MKLEAILPYISLRGLASSAVSVRLLEFCFLLIVSVFVLRGRCLSKRSNSLVSRSASGPRLPLNSDAVLVGTHCLFLLRDGHGL